MTDLISIRNQLESRGYLEYMSPVLSEGAMCHFEASHKISLPEEYRLFLTEIGNGGPGPYYGLLPIEKALDYDRKLWGDPIPEDHLCHPFNYEEAFNPQPEMDQIYQNADDGLLDDAGMQLAIFQIFRGLIGLSHHGCAYYETLVVTGPTHGQVWNDASDAGYGLFPRKVSFFEWYQTWLDGKIVTMWKPQDFSHRG